MFNNLLYYLLINTFFINSNNYCIGDTLNKLNQNTNKTGFWIEYLDSNLKITKRSRAKFYGFVYYEDGIKIQPIGLYTANLKRLKLTIEGSESIKDSIVLLNGIYYLKDIKGRIIIKEEYKQGKIQMSQSFSKNGNLLELFDYTRPYENQVGSFYVESYTEDGSIKFKLYYGKVDGKWKYCIPKLK